MISDSSMLKGMQVLRTVLQRLRWDDQGGYPSRNNGKWNFISASLPQTTPEELDALFALVGVVPDEIVSLGDCKDCKHAVIKHGRRCEQGYAGPCLTCKRPRMSNFVPVKQLTRKRKP